MKIYILTINPKGKFMVFANEDSAQKSQKFLAEKGIDSYIDEDFLFYHFLAKEIEDEE